MSKSMNGPHRFQSYSKRGKKLIFNPFHYLILIFGFKCLHQEDISKQEDIQKGEFLKLIWIENVSDGLLN